MDNKQIRLLTADEIEVKVKKVTASGAVALLYKTARVDMSILDEIFGSQNWTDDYKEIKGNLYCGIGIRKDENSAFVYKWDCGIESREGEDGNQKKGEASDAFKRAGFKWGIGRELYTAPFTFLNIPVKQKNSKWVLDDEYQKFYVSKIEYTENGNIKSVEISDDKGNVVFPKKASKAPTKGKPKTDTQNDTPSNELLKQLADMKIDIAKVAIYYKCDIASLTADQIKAAIKMKQEGAKANG
jgi:hypothetical protein